MSDDVDRFCMDKGFTFQPSYFKQINRKAKVSDRERAYRYICEYMFQGKLPDIKDDDILADFWDGTYPTLHKTKAVVLSKLKEDTSPSTSGGTSRGTSPSTSGNTKPSTSGGTSARHSRDALSEIGNGNGNGKGYGNGEGEPPISPKGGHATAAPSFENVEEFARTEGIRTNIRKFYDYYSARSWTTKGEPVHDWKALLRVWASRDKAEEKPEEPSRPVADFTTCPVCHGGNTSQKGLYAMCHDCDRSFTWTGKDWRQDA